MSNVHYADARDAAEADQEARLDALEARCRRLETYLDLLGVLFDAHADNPRAHRKV